MKLTRTGKGGSLRQVFRISDATEGATFSCRLDKAPFRHCPAKRVYRHLRPGRHVFIVKAHYRGVESKTTKRKFSVAAKRHQG